MTDRDLGFVFVTTDIDSAGVVWAAHLEGVEAPVLVVDWYDRFFDELGLPPGVAPLHFLVDSTADVRRAWPSFYGSDRCELMLDAIDSLLAATPHE